MAGKRFGRAIIVGASSGIGAETAKQLARGGCVVALIARRESELNALAETIRAAGGTAFVYPHDVSDFGDIPALFQQVCRDLGGLDAIFYAAGVMPRIAVDEFDFAKDRAMIEVNVLGAVAWLNEAAVRFAATGAGTIVGIGSVAGDRGRRGQPVYCTSKAALETYLESLRNRVGRVGVRVVTIKPGPVDTPMTRGLDKLPLIIPAEEAARQIVAASERGTRVAYVPGIWRYVMAIIRAIPSALFQKMNI
ncbi:MAG: SDR family NAD(P)-dependent oxidoreductase [Akkermansiaceae bacterium]|nr:SDR family NAD(P)-dependent oxidoreductase [Armatimonadota bacterium]